MVKSTTIYKGKKRCELTHEPSGKRIETDAPKDNQGLGEAFSPTDLVGAALGSCVLTTMAIVGEREGINIEGATATVEKVMSLEAPRRIASLKTSVRMPAHLNPDQRKKLERAAEHCPVKKSIHPDIQTPITFEYR